MAVLDVANDNQDFTLSGVTLLTFTVENEVEMRQLYARIDRGAGRTNRDVVISMLAGTSEFTGVNDQVLKLLPLGLAFARFEDSQTRKLYAGESAALDVLGEYLTLSKTIADFMSGLDRKTLHHGHMFRGPVAAALYATFAVDADDALRFWQSVATGVGFESEAEPASRLRQLLRNINIGGGMLQRGSKGILGAEDLYRACLHAWNRFRSHGEFKVALRPTVLASRPAVR
jgi:hypothetical protein